MHNEAKWPLSIVVEIGANAALGHEESLIVAFANQSNINVFRASKKQIDRSKACIDSSVVAIGSVPFIKHALRQLGKELPVHIPYPLELNHLLYRKVKKIRSLAEAKEIVETGVKLFIKPAEGWKRFTGFIATFESDYRFNGASNSKPVWISEPVVFVSEWRTYVSKNEVLDIQCADGNIDIRPDVEIIKNAVKTLAETEKYPTSYVIDFGVLDTGETSLIEMNDGFSFGAYGNLSAEAYWNVTVNRWQELIK